jgi:hypothetical protein
MNFILEEGRDTVLNIFALPQSTPRTKEAINDFVDHLKKIINISIVVNYFIPSKMPEKAIWVGYDNHLRSLFGSVAPKKETEEVVIVVKGGHILIAGYNDFEIKDAEMSDGGRVLRDAQSFYGTINAIYEFMEKFLDIRWFGIHDFEIDIPKRNRIEFKETLYKYTPRFTWRSGIFLNQRPGVANETNKNHRRAADFVKRHRNFYSSDIMMAGHPFKNWWGLYKDSHPNIFALTNRGNRTPNNKEKNVKLCLTSDEVADVWVDFVNQRLEESKFSRIAVNENDGYNQGHCFCPSCQELDGVPITNRPMNTSDRHVFFANRLNKNVRRLSRQVPLLYFAYGNNRPLPVKPESVLDSNVKVVSVANFFLRRHDNTHPSIQEFLNWSRMTDEIYWRPNIGNPAGLSWGMVAYDINKVFEDFRLVARNKGKGVFFDFLREHWSTQGFLYYIMNKLAWDPLTPKKKLLDDYFERMYGEAASFIRSYYNRCGRLKNNLTENHEHTMSRFFIHTVYTDRWFNKTEKLFLNALQVVAGKDSKYTERINFVYNGFKVSQKIVELRSLVSLYEQDKVKDLSLVQEINKKWDEMYTILDAFGGNNGINRKVLMRLEDTRNDTQRSILRGLIPSEMYGLEDPDEGE